MGGAGLQNPARQLGGNISFAQSLSGSQPATPLDLSYVPSPLTEICPLLLSRAPSARSLTCLLLHTFHYNLPSPTATPVPNSDKPFSSCLEEYHNTPFSIALRSSRAPHHGQTQAHPATSKQEGCKRQDGLHGALIARGTQEGLC